MVINYFHTFTCTKKKKLRFYQTHFYVVCCHFKVVCSFTARWTVQSIYAIIMFPFLWLIIVHFSASWVTCCMSNTADFLCQCIVHGWHYYFFFHNFYGIIIKWFDYKALRDVYRVDWYAETLWVDFSTPCMKIKAWSPPKKKKNWVFFFGGLVLDCITTVSGVQSVVAECSLCICV